MSSNLKIKRICAWCGKEFIAQKTTTACCSKQCANALYKKKKRDEAIKAQRIEYSYFEVCPSEYPFHYYGNGAGGCFVPTGLPLCHFG